MSAEENIITETSLRVHLLQLTLRLRLHVLAHKVIPLFEPHHERSLISVFVFAIWIV